MVLGWVAVVGGGSWGLVMVLVAFLLRAAEVPGGPSHVVAVAAAPAVDKVVVFSSLTLSRGELSASVKICTSHAHPATAVLFSSQRSNGICVGTRKE